MQPVALRRISRRIQPGRSTLGLLHTSTSAASAGGIQLSVDYLGVLDDAIRLAQADENTWTGATLSIAHRQREIKAEARRQAADDARQHAAQHQLEQQLDLVRRDTERRARAAEREENYRQERERIRQEQEQAEQRRRDAEEATRRAAEEAEIRRQERLRPCVICMDENDFAILAELPCSHWSCRNCLRGMPRRIPTWNTS